MTDTDTVPPADYTAYRDCSEGDAIRATAQDGTEYIGTVQSTPGATVIAQQPDGTILEFRGLRDDTGPHILLGIDGKNEIRLQHWCPRTQTIFSDNAYK